MLSFEERKKLHNDKLLENVELVKADKPKEDASEIDRKMYKIMLLPQTEKELEYAEARLGMLVELGELFTLVIEEKIKPISPEKNLFCDFIAERLKEVMDDTYVFDAEKYKKLSEEKVAQIIYGGVMFFADLEGNLAYICKQIGLDFDNPSHQKLVNLLFPTINKDAPKPDFIKDDIEKNMEVIIKEYNAFHKLIEENRISPKENKDTHNK